MDAGRRLCVGWMETGRRLCVGWMEAGRRLCVGWMGAGRRLCEGWMEAVWRLNGSEWATSTSHALFKIVLYFRQIMSVSERVSVPEHTWASFKYTIQ
jgi:hypothetical protein